MSFFFHFQASFGVYLGEANVCPLCQKAQIGLVLQWSLSFWNLIILEATVLSGTFNAAELYGSLCKICAVTQSSLWGLQFLPLYVFEFALLSIVNFETLFVPFQIQSKFTTARLQSRCGDILKVIKRHLNFMIDGGENDFKWFYQKTTT